MLTNRAGLSSSYSCSERSIATVYEDSVEGHIVMVSTPFDAKVGGDMHVVHLTVDEGEAESNTLAEVL